MRRPSVALTLVCVAVAAAAPYATASADASETTEIVRFASIEVSRWSQVGTGYDELREGPGAVRDDDPSTAWEARADAHGDAWILLDWTAADPSPFALDELVVAIDPADAPLRLETGRDRTNLSPADVTFTRAADGVHLRADAPLRALRLHVPDGARVASISVRARAAGSASPPSATGTCDRDGVFLAIAAPGSVGLRIARRDAEGRTVELERRETGAARLHDPSVRFRPRPSTYTYEIVSLLPRAQTSVSVTCVGEPAKGPTTTALHGVVEGFYGRPWPFRDRAKLVRAMAALGLDPYIYAPKDAPKHRAKWREPHGAAELTEFQSLARVAAASGVRVVYAISPGLDIDASSPADRQALAAKVEEVRKGAGIRDAALLMDDITAAPSTALGDAHASLAKDLLASMRAEDAGARLLFVPTVYSGAASKLSAAERAYLAALASLPADVPIAWTGPVVFSPSFDRPGLEEFAKLASRTAEGAWVWDNYPVNDALANGRLYVRPIEGRSALYERTGGLAANAMRHPIASIAALASFGELARDPVAYDAARAAKSPLADATLARALMDDGEPPAALAVLLDELVTHPYLSPDDVASPALVDTIARYLANREAASLDLATRLARLAVADVDLRRELHDASLADELDGYARVTAVAARAALAAMTNDRTPSSGAATEAACLAAGVTQLSWQTIQRAVAKLVPRASLDACPELDDAFDPVAPMQIPPGRVASFDASGLAGGGSGVRWSLIGPPSATIDDSGRVAWTPTRPGRFRLVALAVDSRGAGARVFDVVVGEPSAAAREEGGGCGCRATPHVEWSVVPPLALAIAMLRRRRRRQP